MKKLTSIFVFSSLSFFAQSQQGKVKVTDLETGTSYLTDQIQFNSGAVAANLNVAEQVSNGMEFGLFMAGQNISTMDGKLIVVRGPSSKNELFTESGFSQGYVRLCENTNNIPCMLIWIKKEKS